MTVYSCVNGQSWFDVCLNTYQTLDRYIKLLYDNRQEPNTPPTSGQQITWDETLVKDSSALTLISNNGVIYATSMGIPQQPTIFMGTYYDPRAISYTASADGETTITLTELQNSNTGLGAGALLSVTQEVKELKPAQYTFNPTTGVIILSGGISLAAGETVFILYKVKVTT